MLIKQIIEVFDPVSYTHLFTSIKGSSIINNNPLAYFMGKQMFSCERWFFENSRN